MMKRVKLVSSRRSRRKSDKVKDKVNASNKCEKAITSISTSTIATAKSTSHRHSVNHKEKTRVPSPDELEDKKEMHRIHERQRHYSLNLAIRKVICALPSCGPCEPETKHYILKKTSDYIHFLEEQIADLCKDMSIDHSSEHGHMSFSEPLHTFLDGFQKDIPADKPVTLESLEELMASLNFKVSKAKSFRSKRKSSMRKHTKIKGASLDTGNKKDGSSVEENFKQDGDDCNNTEDNVSESKGFITQESLLEDTSSNNMLCSESPTDLDTSGVSQMDSSTSSNWGSGSLDDGFSSCKTIDQESAQSQDGYSCNSGTSTDVLNGKRESLADLIGCDGETSTKYIPAKIKIGHRKDDLLASGKQTPDQWDEHSYSQTESSVLDSLLSLSPDSSKFQSSYQDAAVPLVLNGPGKLISQLQPRPACVHAKLDKVMMPNISPPVCQPLYTNPFTSDQQATAQQNMNHHPNNYIHTNPTINQSTIPTLTLPTNNILNQTLTTVPALNPKFGYINCTLTNGAAGDEIAPSRCMEDATVHPFQYSHPQQESVFQPVSRTVEIILDIGPDPSLMASYLSNQTSSRRSWINGYQLFSKVNYGRFRDGWPPLKGKDIKRLMGQAWREIPEKYKKLYSERACQWNRWHKSRTEPKPVPLKM